MDAFEVTKVTYHWILATCVVKKLSVAQLLQFVSLSLFMGII